MASRSEPSVILHVLRHELRAHARGFVMWVVPVAGLLVMVSALQPSMAGDGGVLAAKMEAMPEAMRRGFGMIAIDFTRPASYLSINFVYVTLTASLHAAMLGAAVIAKEESQHTGELLYSLPVERWRVLAGKAAATALYAVAYNVLLAGVAIVALGLLVSGPGQPGLIAELFVGTAALACCFGGVGMLLATVGQRPRGAPGAALGVTLGAYLLSVATAAAPGAAAIGTVSPFRHVEPSRIVMAGGVDPVAVAALIAIGVACGGFAIARYRSRDLRA